MPRVIRDSDDEVETKSCIRRTRASAAASIQDSPLRRNTRSSKQLCTIESSPESLNDSNIQPIGPTTRSRIATLDKGMAVNIVKSLRSRKNSGSSDVSEIIEVENDTIEKRVTRRNKAGQSLSGTPTKANLRSRNIRAGSEAKSTPPASRSRRVTRSSSVDPIGNLNDSLGTPVKRRTRASIVPTQPTVTEDEEIKNIDSKSLQNTVIEINEDDSEISIVFNKEKSNRNSLNNAVDTNKNISVKEIFNNSEKFALDSSKKLEDSMTYKSNSSNETIEESTNKSLTILSVYSILESSEFEAKKSKENEKNAELPLLLTHQNIVTNTLSNNSNLNDDESERVNVEVCDSSFTNESIQINDLEYKDELNLDKIELNIKDSYVKLNRTNVVENLLNQKKDESKTNSEKNIKLSNSFRNKVPIVLVNDIVKNNQGPVNKLYDIEIISSSLDCSKINIKNFKIDKNNADYVKIASVNKSNNNLNASIDDDDKEDLNIVNANDNLIQNPICSHNDNETKNCIYINDTDDGSENSIFIHKTSEASENFTSTNESNNEIKNLSSLNTNNNKTENLIDTNKNTSLVENFQSINVASNKSECSIFRNKHKNEIDDEKNNSNFINTNSTIIKNINLAENSEIANGTNNEVNNLIFMIKNENEIVDLVNIKEDNNAKHAIFVNTKNDEINNLICVRKTRDKGKNSLNSTVSIESKNIYDEKDNFITMKQDNNDLNDSIFLQIPKQSNIIPNKLVINKMIGNSSSIFVYEDNESISSVSTHDINNKVKELNNINDKMDSTSFVIVYNNEMEIDKNTEIVAENVTNIDNEVILQPMELNISDKTDNDFKQNKMCGVDKNSLCSAVTDADGAFTPAKSEDNEEANKYHKSQENSFENEEITNNQTHKIKSDDSDSDNSLGKLFQDIPAEEWCHQAKQNRSSFSEVSNENENEIEITINNASKNKKDSSFKASMIQEDNLRTKKNRKSFEEKETNKSLEYKSRDSLEKDTNQSHLYRIRKSYETESENNQSMTFKDTVTKKINSEIQECNTAEIEDENESPNKRPLSINKSLKTNQSSYDQTDESISDKMSSSINENKSLQKSHTSIDTSLRLNQSSFEENENKSISEEFTNSVNNSKIIKKQFTSDTLCKSLMEQSNERLSYEVMDVDEEKNESREIYNKSLNESKDLKKSPFNKSVSKNKSISENGINYSVPAKHLSTNNSVSSLDEHQNQDKSFNDEVEMIEDIDTDKNENDETNNKLEKKYRKSLNKSNLSNQLNQSDLRQINGSLKEKLSDSLNKSKKLKNRLSGRLQPLNDSSNKLLSKNQCLKSESDNEIEENDEKLSNKQTSINLSKSSNDISLNLSKHNESTVSNVKNEISFKNKLLKNTHNKLAIQSDSDEDISSETNNEIINTNNKSLNISSKSSMSIHNSSVKSIPSSFSKNSTTENTENTDESVSNFNLNKTEEASINYGNGQNQMNLDNSIQKNSEMIKFPNLMKQDVSSTTQLESDSGNREIPEYQLHITDEESDTSEEDKEDSCSKEIDSDIAKEYNLSGRSIKKYSDDDVPGDDCRASEEEFSDDDDDGNDLTDFIVPDDQVEQSEDESDDEESDNEDDSEDNEINEAQALHSVKEESLNNLKLNKNESLNNSKLKNNASFNKSNSIKDKSTLQNLSKSVKSETPESRKSIAKDSKSFNDKRSDTSESEYSESLNSDTEEITKNVTSDTNKNMNIASPSSESESESEDGEDSYHVITVDQTNTSCSRSVSSKTKKVTPLIECSTPKPGVIKKNDFSKGADSFADSHNLPIAANKSNFTRHKSESLNDLSDTKIVSSRMSIAEVASKSNHDNSVKFKESIETDDREELTGSIIKNRQAWKLIPLNQTAHMLSNETPVTKYLKKSKLNDSAPDSEIRRSGVIRAEALLNKSDLTNRKSIKKFKKMQKSDEGEEEEAEEKKKAVVHTSLNDIKSKKRKLHDISNPTSSNEDSILKTTKKKRARIEESIIEEAFQLQIENKKPENVQKKKKKEINDKNLKTEEYVVEATEPDVMKVAQQGKKKKKKKKKNNGNNNKNNNNNMEIDQSIEEIAVPDIVKDAQQTKKEKKNKCKEVQQQLLERSQSTDDKKMKKNKEKQQAKCIHKNKQEGQEVSNIKVTKQKKKKVRSNDDRFDQKQLDVEPMKSQIKSNVTSDTRNQQQPKQLKKKKRLIDEDVDDENAPESMGFEEARSSVLTAMQREVEAIRAQKLARRKKQKIEPTAPAEKTSLKRLPDEVLKALTDESTAKKSSKQRKKPTNKADAKVTVPSTSMFSPGKKAPANLEVDDGYVSLNLDGGTTQFGVVNLEKAKKFTKKNAAVISFREKMLSRNLRQPTATYLMYLKKQKSKMSL